ncbi:protein of unknown function [Methylocaldum szegediense]|uniref:Uncharacterized protein n=1 Tax=Methylocaldum szegediense TaxID=73780 RepID=A0ABM9I4K2_9GAMM|nr:protein of unknown function [Methylocaldum szegediense]
MPSSPPFPRIPSSAPDRLSLDTGIFADGFDMSNPVSAPEAWPPSDCLKIVRLYPGDFDSHDESIVLLLHFGKQQAPCGDSVRILIISPSADRRNRILWENQESVG